MVNAGLLWESIRLGVSACKRDGGSVASIILFTAALSLAGLLTVAHIGVLATDSLLSSAAEVRIDIMPDASPEEVQTFSNAVKTLGGVEEVVFLRRDQVVETVRKRDPEVIAFLDTFDLKYPFNDVFVITLQSFESYAPLIEFLEQASWSTVLDPTYTSALFAQRDQLYDLLDIINTIRLITTTFIVMTVLFLFIVLLTWIIQEIRMWGEEIREQLAELSFLRVALPLTVQHTMLLWISCAIATAIVVLFVVLAGIVLPNGPESALFLVSNAIQMMLVSLLPIVILLAIVLMPIVSFSSVSIVLCRMRRSSLST